MPIFSSRLILNSHKAAFVRYHLIVDRYLALALAHWITYIIFVIAFSHSLVTVIFLPTSRMQSRRRSLLCLFLPDLDCFCCLNWFLGFRLTGIVLVKYSFINTYCFFACYWIDSSLRYIEKLFFYIILSLHGHKPGSV